MIYINFNFHAVYIWLDVMHDCICFVLYLHIPECLHTANICTFLGCFMHSILCVSNTCVFFSFFMVNDARNICFLIVTILDICSFFFSLSMLIVMYQNVKATSLYVRMWYLRSWSRFPSYCSNASKTVYLFTSVDCKTESQTGVSVCSCSVWVSLGFYLYCYSYW